MRISDCISDVCSSDLFYIITVGVDAHLWWLLAAVVAGSAIGLYYYLRLMISLFLLDPSKHRFSAPLDLAQRTGGIMTLLAMLLMLALGIFPQPFIHLLHLSTLIPGRGLTATACRARRRAPCFLGYPPPRA